MDLNPSADRFKAMADAARWRSLAPALHVGEPSLSAAAAEGMSFDNALINKLKADLIREGYFQLPPLDWGVDVSHVAEGVSAVVAAGYLPVFAFMYDEPWFLYARLQALLRAVLDDKFMMLPAFWAWHVDGVREGAGWKPHRDLGYRTLLPDRRPTALTVWIPLTEATPRNGCMYILPADRDPVYATPRDQEINIDLQNIRALPSAAGGVLAWTQAVFHWGGRAASPMTTPRISIAVEFQRSDQSPLYEPLLAPTGALDGEERLRLILRQVLQYKHMYPLSDEVRALAEAYAPKSGPGSAFLQRLKIR